MNDLKKLLHSIDVKADWIGLRKVTSNRHTSVVRNENPEGNSLSFDQGLMVEVLVNGQFAHAGTNNLSAQSVKAAAKKAYNLAEKASKFSVFKFNESHRPKAFGHFESPIKTDLDKASLSEMSSLLSECSKAMKGDERIINRVAFAILDDISVEFVSTNGSEFTQHYSKVMSRLNCLAQVGSNTQTRSTEFQVGQGGLELFNKDKLLSGANRITREVLELIVAPECPTDTRDVIITPDQMYLQIHESIGHALELDRILGDERNYAGWSFVNLSDFGKLQYGSPLLNVTFDPTVSGEFASYNFDDTGAKATREYLIQGGILKRGIGGVESQARAKVEGVSSMRSTNWNRAPIDRIGNINLEPGNSSLDDMISATEKGIMMMTNRSWSIDDYRKKFQFGCEYARLIENGKLTTVVKNPNYKGISIPFWNSLKMVGDSETFELRGSPYCGKGEPNQIIWVGHATPACLFSNLEIFGGAK